MSVDRKSCEWMDVPSVSGRVTSEVRDVASNRLAYSVGLALVLLVSGCATERLSPPAPVIDRPANHGGQPGPAIQPTTLPPTSSPVGASGQPVTPADVPPGHYMVKRGDTLIAISLQFGLDYKELAAWNQLENPNRIEVGQVLRVVAPSTKLTGSATAQSAPIASSGVEVRPLDAPAGASTAAKPAEPAKAADTSGPVKDGPVAWGWPSAGRVLQEFNDTSSKGLDIGGKVGDPVTAAGEGKVVYAGNALRGYGNLIIIKHSTEFLSVYAHNRALLVREGDSVKKGQRIAEMGSSDSDRVRLHFEIRRHGKPVDPMKFLPSER